MKITYLKIGMIGGILGCTFVALNEPLFANLVWLFTNPFMILHNRKVKEKGQAILWGIYTFIAIAGTINCLFLGG